MSIVLLICAVATAIVVGTFAWVAWSTRAPAYLDKGKWYRGRAMLFVVLTPLLLVMLGYTIPKAPYLTEGAAPDEVVYVSCKQYGYAVAREPLPDDAAWAAHVGDAPVTVKAGHLVEFKVSALDVNHSVAFYAPDRKLIAQAQAMPNYVNRLRLRFTQPGTYNLLCLEYCGVGHHMMRTSIRVI